MEKIIKHGKWKGDDYFSVEELCDSCGTAIDATDGDYVARHRRNYRGSDGYRYVVYEHEKCFQGLLADTKRSRMPVI